MHNQKGKRALINFFVADVHSKDLFSGYVMSCFVLFEILFFRLALLCCYRQYQTSFSFCFER